MAELKEEIHAISADIAESCDNSVLKENFKKLIADSSAEVKCGTEWEISGNQISAVKRVGGAEVERDLKGSGDGGCDLLMGNDNQSLPKSFSELKNWGFLLLNEVQIATTTILKTGLDQISWEPLLTILEDLSIRGTVSRNRVHECATNVIARVLGVDMIPQVLRQYHSDPDRAEVCLLESLILCYINDLTRKKFGDHGKVNGFERKKSLMSASDSHLTDLKIHRKKLYDKEKKVQPSYQKLTESFKRKQRSKRAAGVDLRVSMKRTVNRQARDEANKIFKKSPPFTPKSNDYSNSSKNSLMEKAIFDPSLTNSDIINRQKISIINTNLRQKVCTNDQQLSQTHCTETNRPEEKKGKDRLSKKEAHTTQSAFFPEDYRSRNRKRAATDWNEIETETAVETYLAERDMSAINHVNVRTSSRTSSGGKNVPGGFRKNKLANELCDQSNENRKKLLKRNSVKVKNCSEMANRTPDPTCNRRENLAVVEDECNPCKSEHNSENEVSIEDILPTPETDVGEECVNVDVLEKSKNSQLLDDGSECLVRVEPVFESFIKPTDKSHAQQSETEQTFNEIKRQKSEQSIEPLTDSSEPLTKETSTCFSDTSDSATDSNYREGETSVPHFSSILSPVRVDSDTMYTMDAKSSDNPVSFKISEELMNVLKEQFMITSRISESSFRYRRSIESSGESLNVPYTEIEQMRAYNGKILKRLNFISTLTVLALLSSILTTGAFYLSSDPHIESAVNFVNSSSCFFSGWFQ